MVDEFTKAAFERDGYAVLSGVLAPGVLEEIRDEIMDVGRRIVGPRFEFDAYDPELVTPERQSALYDRLHYLPSLTRLAGNKKLLDTCRDLGLQIPILMGCDNMRYDRPHDGKHLFEWHQDTLYLLGSVNAVTIWIPFGPVDEYHGTIEVIPGSHARGLYPFKRISDKPIEPDRPFLQRDLAIDYEPVDRPVMITADWGDVVVFKQMLLHKSCANNSDRVRWTAQVRITDFGSPEFLAQGCPSGDKTNIFFQDYPGFRHPLSVARAS